MLAGAGSRAQDRKWASVKLYVLIVQDYDAPELLRALINDGFKVTQVSSTGGFLRAGNTTLLVGVDESESQRLLRLVERNCSERVEVVHPSAVSDFDEWYPAEKIEVEVGGATVFAFNVVRYERA